MEQKNNFKVTVEHMGSKKHGEHLDYGEYNNRIDAIKFKRKMMNKHELINYHGYIVNFQKHIELHTTF